MNIPRLVLACVLLVSSTPLVAQELSSSRVVLLRMSGDPGTDSSRTADLTAMSEIMSKEFTRLAGSDFTVVADDRDFTGLSDTGRKAVCIRHGARWAVFGSAYFKKDDRDLITFKLWYFDAVTGTYDSEYSQGTMRTLPFHIRRLVRGMFYLMAKETNFFIKQEGSSVPSMRKIIICEPSFNNNFQGGTFEKFRGDLISLIKKDLGDRLEIASDQAYRFLVLPPTVDYRDVKRLKRVSGLSGANWVLFAEMYQNEEKINLSLYLYNDQKGSYDSIYGEKLTSYAEAISFIDKGINDIYMRISRADGYYLHENNAVRYVREFTDFGVPESNLFQFYVYGVERDGSDLLVAAMFTVVRLDRNGAVKTVYGRRGTGRGEFQTAMKVRARGGKVYIYDSTGKMLVFRDDGSFVREFTIGTSYAGSFAIAENGSIFVPIVQDRKITLFDENGRRVRDISFPDTDTVMAVSQGEKTVTALLMHNTEYLFRDYDFTGNPVAERSIPRSDYYISAFRRDGRGNIYCLDMTKKLFFKIGAAGRVLWLKDQLDIYPTNGLNNPMDIEISAAGDEIFIADYMNRRVVKFKEFSGLAQCANETGCLAAAARLRDTDQDGYLSLLNHALYIRQDHVPALAELAGFYGRVGGYERAVGLWEQVLEIDNGNAAATAGLRKDRTRMSLRAGDVHAKQFRDTMAQVGPEAARKFYEEAVKNYELALKASPDDAGIRAKYQDLKNEY
ncbi:MAG TPA: hypothetical protein PKI31_19300, partial [Spirochaetota bacterium]|nr:hypothetical protein [Spirochaetota bacterium]